LQLSQLAINLSQNQNQSCNEREPDKPMIASQGSYDCKPLHLTRCKTSADFPTGANRQISSRFCA